MKILVLSKNGDGLGLAYRMANEGNEVKVFIKKKGYEYTGLNMVEIIPSFRPELTWAEFILCDSTGFGEYEKLFKEYKVQYLGANKMGDILDKDPTKVADLGRKFGFKTPLTWILDKPSSGTKLINEWREGGFVVKCTTEAGKSTIICRDKKTLFWVLSRYPEDAKMIIQENINGTSFSIEGWFNGVSFMQPYFLIFNELGQMKAYPISKSVVS